MKTLWAVACAALTLGLIASGLSGCASGPEKKANASGKSAAVAQVQERDTERSPHSQDNATSPASAAEKEAAQRTAGQAFQTSLNYRIGPEDILRVSVWENKELTLDVTVRPDGKISLPLIQDVQAEGLTAVELGDVIHQKLRAFLVEPQVSVIVIQVNAPKIYVIGSVVKPGPHPLRSDISVLQALSLAGGLTQFASPRSIKLVRGTGAKQEVRKINYFDLIAEGGEGNYLLKPGDTIVVP